MTPIAAVVTSFVLASPAAAQFSQFDWTLEGNQTGSGELTATEMVVTGPFNGFCTDESTYFQTTADRDGTVNAFLDWDNLDPPYHWDFPAYVINGEVTRINEEFTSPNFAPPFSAAFSFDVQAGDTFGLGVLSLDCFKGPGIATFTQFEFVNTECLLVIGNSVGEATFFDIDHLFETQLDGVEDSYAVLMEDIPEFVLPGPELAVVPTGVGMAGTGSSAPVDPQTDVQSWMWDGHFTVQILMWNPEVFPAQPEQSSHGLKVYVAPDGSVSARPYGTATGISVWAELDVNAEGQPVVRFPFSISGM